MRWPSGPLDIARQSKLEGFSQTARQTLERWHEPASLDILKGSPVDCIVISWAGGLPEDASQQTTAAALVGEARKRNLAVVGWVDGQADSAAAIASAKSGGLDAVAIEGFSGTSDFPVIAWGGHAKEPWEAPSPVLAVTGNVWPGVRAVDRSAAESADAGPTAAPWLDSNAWYVQLARARVSKPLWMLFDPPGKNDVISEDAYTLAVCDTEGRGGRWVISLDGALRAGLAAGNAEAEKPWQAVVKAASFFAGHSAWREFHSLGVLGVISDFAGDHYDTSGEILNLMARNDLLFRVLWKSQAAAAPFTGLKALLHADATQPEASLRRKMMTFAEEGGLLITGPGWGSEGTPIAGEGLGRYEVRSFGKGRLAVAKEELYDPYEIAGDVHILVSYANDLFKIFNSSSSGCSSLTGSADGKSALLQTLSFASARGARTAWVKGNYKGARLWSIGAETPVRLQPTPAQHFSGQEYDLPVEQTGKYLALEFEA